MRLGALPLLLLTSCTAATTTSASPSSAPTPQTTAPAPSPTTVQARKLDAATPMKTASSTPFTVSSGWYVTEDDGRLLLEDPERQLRLTLLEVPGPSAERALAEAWKQTQPGFALPVSHAAHPPAQDGWDEVFQTTYEPPAREQRVIVGLARRKGDTNYVILLDGAAAAMERRGAQANQILLGFKSTRLAEESFAGKAPLPLTPERLRSFESFLEQARATMKIPGVAVAVVQGNQVLYEKGFGVRELGKPEPVTPQTLFLIGSTSKSLTTLMMARLVDEGHFTWETPATQLLPGFSLADAEVTKKLTVRNTVCACTGMPRQDMEMLFEYAGVTGEQRIAEMRRMKPTTRIGETYQYSNPMVTAGGYMAAHAAEPRLPLGQAYDRVMQTRVFDALGMKSTTFDFARAAKLEHASPHGMTATFEYAPLPLSVEEAVVPVRPAGGAWSNLRDMERYVMLELSKGRTPEGQQLVSEANLLARREPQVKMTDKKSYGLGLMVGEDHGARLIQHGGNTLGFSSDMFFLPEANVGVVLLTNVQGDGPFRNAVRRKFLEILFDGRDEARNQLDFTLKNRREQLEKGMTDIRVKPDLEWMKTLAGTWHNEGLGRVTLRVEGSDAVFDAGEWRSSVGEKQEKDGSRTLILLDPPLAGFEFQPKQEAASTTLVLELPQQRYVFEKQAAQASDKP
ncbi:beta-lactamase family protein [Archangium violaceum]|uniref:serine hydrolase domain-containing protein n=1 Tax=Archangium violaceum TaxID=83451 RepID=UPI00193B0C00|nr:serine hydrolase domain-containing protein [Archangium violaceum]QRK06890.1 beta-lactamase family protein [Archangium violaceum]